MKLIERTLTSLLFIPAIASAHPGHDQEGYYSSFGHPFSGIEPQLILFAVALLAVAALWLVKHR